MSRKLTQEEYVKRVKNINPNIEIFESYINNSVKILHKCKIDGYEWYVRPSSILSGSGCPRCSNQEKYGHDEYVKRVKKINPKIEVAGIYINSSTPILHKCLVDGHEWHVAPNNILSGKGCPMCGGTMLKPHKQYVEDLKIKNPLVIAIEKYINNSTKIAHKCLIHNYEWETTPASALNGCGCPICTMEKARKRLAKDHDEYVKEVSVINKNISVISRYVNSTTKITHRCLVCGWEWDTLPHNILQGHGCPQCNKCSKSIGEKIISDWLDNNNILYQKQKTFDDCKDKYVLRFDFYLPEYDILIEYNGKQHYEPIEWFGGQEAFETQILRDKIKEEYCNKNNIFLFKIPYFVDINKELIKLYDLIKEKNTVKEVAI